MEGDFKLNTRQVAMTAMWAAIYAVALLIPFSQFIGGAGFITLGIIMVPVFCKMLKPVSAMVAGVFGMVIAASVGAAIVPVYGLFSFIIPLTAGLLGSLAFHYRWGAVPGIIFLGLCSFLYATYSGGTLLWIVPYAVAMLAGIGTLVVYNFKKQNSTTSKTSWLLITGFCIFLTTTIENATMNLGSIFILKLPGDLWTVITPVSMLERTIVWVLAFVILLGLWKRFGGKIKELEYD